jgi:hypothetical protein
VKVSFQADADFNENIVRGVVRREPQIDFQTATKAGLSGLSDLDVLNRAARNGRILVSHDRKTMPHAFASFVLQSMSPGLLIVSQKTELIVAIEGLIEV